MGPEVRKLGERAPKTDRERLRTCWVIQVNQLWHQALWQLLREVVAVLSGHDQVKGGTKLIQSQSPVFIEVWQLPLKHTVDVGESDSLTAWQDVSQWQLGCFSKWICCLSIWLYLPQITQVDLICSCYFRCCFSCLYGHTDPVQELNTTFGAEYRPRASCDNQN